MQFKNMFIRTKFPQNVLLNENTAKKNKVISILLQFWSIEKRAKF